MKDPFVVNVSQTNTDLDEKFPNLFFLHGSTHQSFHVFFQITSLTEFHNDVEVSPFQK